MLDNLQNALFYGEYNQELNSFRFASSKYLFNILIFTVILGVLFLNTILFSHL